jgi:hypothetical protein
MGSLSPVGDLFDAREATFYGPGATFQSAAQSSVSPQSNPGETLPGFEAVLVQIDRAIRDDDVMHSYDQSQWRRLQLLAKVCAGISLVDDEPAELIALLKLQDDEQPLESTEDAWKFYQDALRKATGMGFDLLEGAGSHAIWRLLNLISHWSPREEKAPAAKPEQERTPIFLATEKGDANNSPDRVLFLVAERWPGPRLITPDWWRLGLVPLGPNREFLSAVHTGFQAVLDSVTDIDFQIRWWLETYKSGGEWHEKVEPSDSAQVSATCVGLALSEKGLPRPLLDPTAGVSARLLDSNRQTPLLDRRVGPVGLHEGKIKAATTAGIRTLCFAEDGPANNSVQSEIVQPVATVGDAYEAILLANKSIRSYREKVCEAWDAKWDEEPTDPAFVPNPVG